MCLQYSISASYRTEISLNIMDHSTVFGMPTQVQGGTTWHILSCQAAGGTAHAMKTPPISAGAGAFLNCF